jgi:hypothetical protein
VTSDLCERVISNITQWRRVKRWNNKWYDIISSNWDKIEAKVWRVWNSAVVKQNQLFEFDSDFWGFLFYRTIKNLPPSYYTSKKNAIWPVATLKRNISIEIAYIFPTEVMRYFWNTANVKRWMISTTWISHRPLANSRAEWLIKNYEIPWTRWEKEFQYWRHKFSVKSIDFNL